MRITIRHTANFGHEGVEYVGGTTHEVPDELAVKWLRAGLAVPAPPPEPETAVVEPQERAVKPKARSRKA